MDECICGVSCACCCECGWDDEEPSYTPSLETGQFDAVKVPVPKFVQDTFTTTRLDNASPSVSGGAFFFPTLRNVSKTNKKGKKKMAKVASFKLVVKDGHTDYKFDAKSGQYKSKMVDYVEEFSDLAAALAEFFVYVSDEYNEDKVSLVFVPGKKK